MHEKIQLNDKFPNKEVLNEKNMMGKEAFINRFTQFMTKALDEWEQSKAAKEKDG
jgi:hypothetical protein